MESRGSCSASSPPSPLLGAAARMRLPTGVASTDEFIHERSVGRAGLTPVLSTAPPKRPGSAIHLNFQKACVPWGMKIGRTVAAFVGMKGCEKRGQL